MTAIAMSFVCHLIVIGKRNGAEARFVSRETQKSVRPAMSGASTGEIRLSSVAD
jgi:hypothetical protein